jgi:hypothetical protein
MHLRYDIASEVPRMSAKECRHLSGAAATTQGPYGGELLPSTHEEARSG